VTRYLVPTIAALLLIAVSDAGAGVTKGRPLETGQTTSYGEGTDGDLRPGLTRLFIDLNNGVVKDRRTGLFWEKKSNDGSIHDKDNVYGWALSLPVPVVGETFSGSVVSNFLANLNTPPCFAGFCDWRLPTFYELQTLVNIEKADLPAFAEFDTGCTPGCSVTQCSCTGSDFYWTSSTWRAVPTYAWVVYFSTGSSSARMKTEGGYARAVRGGF